MTTSINWPAALPLPSIAGYQIKPVSNADRTEVETGPARQRRRSISTRDMITVQFGLTLWEQAVFEGFHRNVVFEGVRWFNITLLGGTGLLSYEARFVIGQDITYTPRTAESWLAQATLEVRDRPIMSADDVEALAGEDLAALQAALASFHTLMTTGTYW